MPGSGDDKAAQPGHTKATREDWLRAAMDLLVSGGVGEVKIQTIGARLGVSRSSFYWYFKSRRDLLDQLLAEWDRTNTATVIRHAGLPADTITGALALYFRCLVGPDSIDHALDFAVRDWARRDRAVQRILDRADAARHRALEAMFLRHGYAPDEADIRARVLYHQQIGYFSLDLTEPLEERLGRAEGYLYCFTGVRPAPEEVAELVAYSRNHVAY